MYRWSRWQRISERISTGKSSNLSFVIREVDIKVRFWESGYRNSPILSAIPVQPRDTKHVNRGSFSGI